MIYLKTKSDLEKINHACKIWNIVKNELIKNTKIGISTKELDLIAKKVIEDNGCTCSFYHYEGFPGYICISVNEEIVHGIGNDYKIKNGDLITFDIGVTYQNRICDSAFSIIVGKNDEAQKLLDCAYDCLYKSISVIKEGIRVGDIESIIQETANNGGYEVLKEYSGHGCGIKLHEDPKIFCHGKKGTGAKLLEGMVLCIEPMLLIGTDKTNIYKDWIVSSKNKKLTCHVETMVYVTKDGYIDLIKSNCL